MAERSFLDASDPAQVKEARKRESFAARQEGDDYRAVMGTAQGRRFVAAILRKTVVGGATFDPDPMHMQFVAGRRSVGMEIHERCHAHCVGLFRLMEDEAQKGAAAAKAQPVKEIEDESGS